MVMLARTSRLGLEVSAEQERYWNDVRNALVRNYGYLPQKAERTVASYIDAVGDVQRGERQAVLDATYETGAAKLAEELARGGESKAVAQLRL